MKYATDPQRGAILYFTIIMMSILMAAVFSITSIVLVELRSTKQAGDSVIAFYAADTGIENALNDLYNFNPAGDGRDIQAGGVYSELLDGLDYRYEVFVVQPTDGGLLDRDSNPLPKESSCEEGYYCIKSIGIYRNTRRAIEVKG